MDHVAGLRIVIKHVREQHDEALLLRALLQLERSLGGVGGERVEEFPLGLGGDVDTPYIRRDSSGADLARADPVARQQFGESDFGHLGGVGH